MLILYIQCKFILISAIFYLTQSNDIGVNLIIVIVGKNVYIFNEIIDILTIKQCGQNVN